MRANRTFNCCWSAQFTFVERTQSRQPLGVPFQTQSLCVCVVFKLQGLNYIQNRANLPNPALCSVTQKLILSLHTPPGWFPAPTGKDPIGFRSVAFHSETLKPLKFTIITLSPSNPSACGLFNPLPVKVAITVPDKLPCALTTVTVFEEKFGTQIFVPSKTGNLGSAPTMTSWAGKPLPMTGTNRGRFTP
jgi:hypothetical protein